MSNQIGAYAESVFCTWALSRGFYVSFPARGLQVAYDCVLDLGPDRPLGRVQVKAVQRRRNRTGDLRVDLRHGCGGGAYNCDEVDYIAAVDLETGRIWLIPMWLINDKRSLGLTDGTYDKWLVPHGN